jgi:hypothetical protein
MVLSADLLSLTHGAHIHRPRKRLLDPAGTYVLGCSNKAAASPVCVCVCVCVCSKGEEEEELTNNPWASWANHTYVCKRQKPDLFA